MALGVVLAVLTTSAAQAEPFVQAAIARRHHIAGTLKRIDAGADRRAARVARELMTIRHHLARSSSPRVFDPSRWASTRRHVQRAMTRMSRRLTRYQRSVVRHVRDLRLENARLKRWLAGWGTLRTCPVDGPNVVINNFGVIVNLPEVPVHVHQGNDIMAAAGTPIVAPFAGVATASSSTLGGQEVRVTGAAGYVYNAHLSAYGTLGVVKTGDVIGYVGTTGDATGPHDHFEWHPGGGPAVDPNPLLSVVC